MVKVSHIWHNGIQSLPDVKLASLYSKSVTHENSKCADFPLVQVKHTVQNWPFCLSFQTEWKNDSYLTQNEDIWNFHGSLTLNQGLLKYQISFLLSKVSELWKFQMCWFCVSTDGTHSSNLAIFSFIPNRMKKWLIFDTKWRHLELSRLTDFE